YLQNQSRNNMFDIGFSELMLVGVMGLIILGPERLPKAARTLGLMVGRVRNTISGFQLQIEQEVANQEIIEKLKDPTSALLNDDELTDIKDAIPADNNTDQRLKNSNKERSRESVFLPDDAANMGPAVTRVSASTL
ncbi:twin arginine-targeting protein translocase TatB, partial [Oleispira antarctica]